MTAPERAPRAFWRWATGWLAAPAFADQEQAQRARIFQGVALTTLALVNVILPLVIAVQPNTLPRALLSIAVVDSVAFVTLALNRRGRTRLASWMYISIILALLTFNALTGGGIRSPGVQAYFIFVMLAGLLLGERVGVITGLGCAVLGLMLVLLESIGAVSPQPIYSALPLWLLTCVFIGVALMTMQLATSAVRRSLTRAEETQVRLQERVKELRLLHEATQLLHERAELDRNVLAELVARMPAAWMHADDCRARITYQDEEVTSPGWLATPWRLATAFATSQGRGTVEVVYLTDHPLADEGPFLAEERALLDSLAELLRSRVEARCLEEQLRHEQEQAAEARFAAMLDERTRIALELHDTLLQGFTGVGLKLVAVANRMKGSPSTAALREVIAEAQGTLEHARRAIWDMRPPSPGGGFVATLRAAVEEGLRGIDLRHDFAVDGAVRPADPDVETAVFRVTLEAIANVVKHAAARTVRVVLAYEPTRIRLAVTDDGRGFVVDPALRAYDGHLGLLGMHERASRAHGTLTVRSSPGHGTEVVLLVPLEAP